MTTGEMEKRITDLETELDEKVREYMLSVVDAVIPDIMVDVGDLYN